MNVQKHTHLVLGAGAMGLFIAHELSLCFPQDRLLVLSKVPTLLPVKIKKQSGQVQNAELTPQAALPADFNADFLSIYVCTPPEATPSLFSIFEEILAKGQVCGHLSLFFLNNGLIDVSAVQSLAGLLPQGVGFEVLRGLVLCGFMRHLEAQHICIEHTGGRQIFFRPIFHFPDSVAAQKLEPLLSQLNFFDFVYEDKIIELELAKFFINSLLGLWIGPKLLSNGEFFNFMSLSELEEAARHFCCLFSATPLDSHFVFQYFLQAVKNTSKNINSVSVSWQQGRTDTIRYFVQEIEKRIESCLHPETRLFFQNMLQRTFYQYE